MGARRAGKPLDPALVVTGQTGVEQPGSCRRARISTEAQEGPERIADRETGGEENRQVDVAPEDIRTPEAPREGARRVRVRIRPDVCRPQK